MTDRLHLIASVSGREVRLGLWAEALESLPAGEGAELLDRVVRASALHDSEALAAYLPLLDLPELTLRVGAAKLAEILKAARDADRDACLLLLEYPGRRAAAETLGPPPDPVLESLTLGHRKSAARGLRGPLLDRILRDPDPRVVREVLRNPRLREPEVLAIASRRPCPEEVFWMLVRAESWVARQPVRRAIALNPYAPPRLAVALLPTLPDADLADLAKGAVFGGLAEAASRVQGWRRDAEGGKTPPSKQE